MAANDDIAATRKQQTRSAIRRASVGRALVAFAVFGPVLLIVGAFLRSRGNIYAHSFGGPKLPLILFDVALLLLGMRLMRGEDL